MRKASGADLFSLPRWVPSSESYSELPAPVFIATLCPRILSRPFPLADERTELESSADVEVRGTTALLDEPAIEVEADDVRRKSGKGATALKEKMASLADDEALTADGGYLLTTLIDDDKTVDEGALAAVGRPGRGGLTSKKD
jgi:hypothetical protein